jgi:hypothetical protein
MIVDIVGAFLFFALGVIVGLNRDLFRFKPEQLPQPMATTDPDLYMYGKHKISWFQERTNVSTPGLNPKRLNSYPSLRPWWAWVFLLLCPLILNPDKRIQRLVQ